MRWVLKRLKRHQRKSYRKRHHPKKDICYHEPALVAQVSKEIVDFVSRDELLLKLAQELGPTGFNDWFKETFGKPAPYIDTHCMKSMGRFKSNRMNVKKEILDEAKKEKDR